MAAPNPTTTTAPIALERPRLLRIPFSTYCRKTEWGLTHAGIAYDTLDVSIPGMRHIKKANPTERTVPVLRTTDDVIPGSHAILAWADDRSTTRHPALFPEIHAGEVVEWEQWADTHLGPLLRREVYRVLHSDIRPWAKTALGRARLWALKPGFRIAAKHYDAVDDHPADTARLHEALAKTVQRLRENDTGYLFGPHATAADMATAAFWEPMMRIGEQRGIDRDDGWGELNHYVRMIRPAKTTKVDTRRIRKRDWEDFKRFNLARTNGQHAPVNHA